MKKEQLLYLHELQAIKKNSLRQKLDAVNLSLRMNWIRSMQLLRLDACVDSIFSSGKRMVHTLPKSFIMWFMYSVYCSAPDFQQINLGLYIVLLIA